MERIDMIGPVGSKVRYAVYPHGRDIPGTIIDATTPEGWAVQSEGAWRSWFEGQATSPVCEPSQLHDIRLQDWDFASISASRKA
jgi:hypothetical protein